MAYDKNQIDQIFQQALGRAGTDAEHSFLNDYVSNGYISPYEISQYLGSTPEAMQKRQAGAMSGYQNLLTQGNQQILRQAADAANAYFAQNGRQFSSGQPNSVLQAGQQLAAQQSPLLAQFYGNQAGNLNEAYMGQGQAALSRAYGLRDLADQRKWDLYTYNLQRQNTLDDTMNLMNTQNRQNMQNGLVQGGIGLLKSALQGAGMAASGGSTLAKGFGF